MKIKPDIDLSQFYDENGEFTKDSERRFAEYVDGYYTALVDNKPRINAAVCILKGRINEKLSEKRQPAFDAVVGLVNSEEYDEIQIYDLELHYFPTAIRIYQLERGFKSGGTILDQIGYIDDFKKLYTELLFYFRRIQMGMNKAAQMECLAFIRANKLSVFAVAEIALDCDLGEKEVIMAGLAEFYDEQGGTKEALYLLNMALEHGRPEYKEYLESRRDIMMEKREDGKK